MKFVSGVFYDEVTPKIAENATHTQTGCMKFVSGVLYDEVFHKRPDDATHRQDAPSWCMACLLLRPPPDWIRQDA